MFDEYKEYIDVDCDDNEEFDEEEFDCGFIPGRGCVLSGSEDCDWGCPYSRLIMNSPYYPNCDLLGNEANDPDTLENDEPMF